MELSFDNGQPDGRLFSALHLTCGGSKAVDRYVTAIGKLRVGKETFV